ncbi:MAG: primosomal protein N' [Bacteroidales bacterium]|nr:primosomal protein N' [Bacteroidales bacterium]
MRVTHFADVLLPLPLPALFTYRVPYELDDAVAFGKRVIVPFGRSKLYSALVVRVHENAPQVTAKYILDVVDDRPVISERQFQLWQWMADYYLCTLGEVMAAALPSALKLASETKIHLHPNFSGDVSTLNPNELHIAEALTYKEIMTVDEISKAVNIQKVIPIIKSLVDKRVVVTDEEVRNPYKAKKETYVRLGDEYASEASFMALLDQLNLSTRTAGQADGLLAFIMLTKGAKGYDFSARVPKSQVVCSSALTPARLQTLLKKGFLKTEEVIMSRLTDFSSRETADNIQLSEPQQKAFQQIHEQFGQFPVVLLHGVTGSGKTEIYIKLIDEVLKQGKQVLYLLPEIALTSQIVNRLRKYFGEKVGVYHSRFNEYERVEIWNRVLEQDSDIANTSKYQLILGARSALLLPYQNLGLIIVDEEHDASYKQQDPAPRYHARDCAIVLGNMHKAKTLLGTATPSLESYYNVKQNKYGLVELMRRFAQSKLPDIWVVNMIEARKQRQVQGVFSDFLIERIGEALDKKEQVILFQNRRGYAVRMICNTCQTMPTCKYCDVTLTYHKKSRLLKCHYCGYAIDVPQVCPTCHSTDIEMKGFGTEKVEDTLAEIFPQASIARMDLDTTRSKNGYQQIISDFEQHKTDILVGTQMVTKGLDFDRVSVVGILNADALISFPDFRSFERAFQLLAQVSGRAGRKEVPGKVVIQSYQPEHPALKYVETNDFMAMYRSQIAERKEYHYPPVTRLVKITLKHPDEKVVTAAAQALAIPLREAFPGMVLGPEAPLVSRIQNYYLEDFWVKFPKDNKLEQHKKTLWQITEDFKLNKPFKSVRVVINVDA